MTLHRARPPRPTPVPPVRRLASIGAAAALGLSLSACSGSPGTSAPSDASEDDFCEAYSSLQERVFEDLDLGATEEEQAQKVADAVRAWAEDLAAAGTPEGIPDEAREGYEVFVDAVQDLPDDVTTADLDDLERDLSEDEQAAAEDFTSYAEDLCPSTFPTDLSSQLDDLEDELPSDLPSELLENLPSDFPYDELPSDLPSDFPSELLENLPSDFPYDELPSDFPSELLEDRSGS